MYCHFEEEATNTENRIRFDRRDHTVWVAAVGAVEVAGHCSCELAFNNSESFRKFCERFDVS